MYIYNQHAQCFFFNSKTFFSVHRRIQVEISVALSIGIAFKGNIYNFVNETICL